MIEPEPTLAPPLTPKPLISVVADNELNLDRIPISAPPPTKNGLYIST